MRGCLPASNTNLPKSCPQLSTIFIRQTFAFEFLVIWCPRFICIKMNAVRLTLDSKNLMSTTCVGIVDISNQESTA